MRTLILGFLSALLLVAAPAVLAGDLFTVQKKKVNAEASSDAALVYVVRPAFMGKAIKMWAFADETPLGVNKGKHYHFATVPAGTHVFWAKSENTSALELEVKAGETYYLKQFVKMGGMKARVKLGLISEQEGQAAIAKCKNTQLTEEGKARGAEIAAEKHQVAIEKAAERKAKGDDD
jgi:hypothetical protein